MDRPVSLLCVLLAAFYSGQTSAQEDFDALFGSESPAEQGQPESNSSSSADTNAETASQDLKPAEPVPSPDDGKRGSRVIENIIVTAQKREENLSDVPIIVNAHSGEKLEALGVEGPIDLPQITPGLQYDSLVGYSIIYLRGVGTDQFLPNGDPSVATYIDGIYFPFSHGLATDFGKLERIEVLKGPQGTLFGRNSTAGAINVTTAKPNQEQMEGSLAAEFGDYNKRNFKGYISGPFTDTLSASLSVIANEEDNYYERPAGSAFPDFEPEKTTGFNARLNWEPTDTLGMTINTINTRQSGLYSVVTTSFDVKPAGLLLVEESPRPYQTDPDDDIHFRASSDTVYGELRWSPAPVDVKLLGSRQEITTDTSFDFEGSSADLINFHPKDQGAEITTAELQILSNDTGLFTELWDRPMQWIAGLYYFKTDNAGFRDLEVPVADGILDPPPFVEDILAGLGIPSGIDLHITGVVDTIAYAGFLQGSWDVTENIGLTLGARYQDEERELRNAVTSVLNADNSTTPLLNFADRKQSTSQWAPKVTLDYKFGEDSLAFLSWQRGFKSGTFNIVNIYSPPPEVTPEKLTNYELGIKGNLLDGTLQYNYGLFLNNIEDPQVLFISVQSGGAVTLENAGESEIYGTDLDITWQPLPGFLPGLVVTAAGAYLKGEYKEYNPGTGFQEGSGLFSANLNFTGNETVRTPEYSYNLGVTYTFDALGGNFELGASTYYNDGYFFSAQNKDSVAQPSYRLINARASYLYEPWGLRLSIFGRNIGDELYWYNQFETDFNTIGTLAPPETWSARIDWQF